MFSVQPLVSIIVPIYNSQQYILDTIKSVINQTWRKWELILIDDGSSDNSTQKVRPFLNENISLVSQYNQGASSARNHGLKLAQGDFIQFLDADDLLSPNKIEKQIHLASNSHEDTLFSCAWGRFINNPSVVSLAD